MMQTDRRQCQHNSLDLTLQLGKPWDRSQKPIDSSYSEQQLPLLSVEVLPATPENLQYFGRIYQKLRREARRAARKGRAGVGQC